MISKDELKDLIIKNNNDKIELWTACFYHKKPLQKIIRNVKPQKVKINFSEKVFQNIMKYKIYNFMNYLMVYDDYDNPVKYDGKCCGDYDSLKFFLTEEECQEYYNKLVYNDIKDIENEKIKVEKTLNQKIKTLKDNFYKSDYMMEKISRG